MNISTELRSTLINLDISPTDMRLADIFFDTHELGIMPASRHVRMCADVDLEAFFSAIDIDYTPNPEGFQTVYGRIWLADGCILYREYDLCTGHEYFKINTTHTHNFYSKPVYNKSIETTR